MIEAGSLGWSGVIHWLLLVVTQAGAGAVLLGLLALYCWWIDPVAGRRLGILMGVTFLLNDFLKQFLDLPRPYELEPGLASEAARLTGPGPGFPSGHTQNATTFWAFLAWWHDRRWLTVLALCAVTAAGASRILLGVHFALDVLGGLALGLVVAWAGVRLPEPPRPRSWAGGAVALTGALTAVWVPPIAPAVGFGLGCLLSRSDHRVPTGWGGRLVLAAGGAALLIAAHLTAVTTLALAGPLGPEAEAAALYGEVLGVTWLGLDRWPRWHAALGASFARSRSRE